MRQSPLTSLHGIHPVLFAFFDRDGRLDADAMQRQVDHCVDSGAHGLMVLGLMTEFDKLDRAERLDLVRIVGAANAGRLPLAATVAGTTPEDQRHFACEARERGADWIILQPPAEAPPDEAALIRFFGLTADALDCPVAIQHNPFNLPVFLTVDGIAALHRQHPNFTVIKAEGTAVETQTLIEATEGRLTVFGGHGGLELPTLLRAGAHGLMPASDCVLVLRRIYDGLRSADARTVDAARDLHCQVLPMIVFMMRTIGGALCYGKRLVAHRLGLAEVFDREPVAVRPTPFGLAEVDRFVAVLERLERRQQPGTSERHETSESHERVETPESPERLGVTPAPPRA